MQIEYVGKQDRHRDRLYGTGATWRGHGDIQEVDDEVGAIMLDRHPDQYRAVTPEEPAAKASPRRRSPRIEQAEE